MCGGAGKCIILVAELICFSGARNSAVQNSAPHQVEEFAPGTVGDKQFAGIVHISVVRRLDALLHIREAVESDVSLAYISAVTRVVGRIGAIQDTRLVVGTLCGLAVAGHEVAYEYLSTGIRLGGQIEKQAAYCATARKHRGYDGVACGLPVLFVHDDKSDGVAENQTTGGNVAVNFVDRLACVLLARIQELHKFCNHYIRDRAGIVGLPYCLYKLVNLRLVIIHK